MLTRIIDRIYLGDRNSVLKADSADILRENGIQYVLNVAKEVDYKYPLGEDFTTLHLPINDNEPVPKKLIHRAINFIGSSVARGKVLVHCSGGISRSPSMIIAYLIRIGYSYPTALRIVESITIDPRAGHSWILPAQEILDSIRDYFGIEIYETRVDF